MRTLSSSEWKVSGRDRSSGRVTPAMVCITSLEDHKWRTPPDGRVAPPYTLMDDESRLYFQFGAETPLEGNGPFTRWLHEITHGYHHKYPDDADRLVMPLGAPIGSMACGSAEVMKEVNRGLSAPKPTDQLGEVREHINIFVDGESIRYSQDHEAVLQALEKEDFQAAFILNPPKAEEVLAIASKGEKMPQKSTYFYPKVPTGLVFNPLA
mgnify:CR=1 FL=1